eukprot:CAMPEP_0203747900 /NCGR_PEP_ID=MMETSP0098-20131031/2920_1 /ASSEMBLY_ACC=CAM_ASM_000208 /TAXON_ID=96639 /ORGANISM=" , Strain NY0313808BC1" /LENGTH=404 /DNA_ID=CAMNT_0050636477 /DNA_START=33 /DNA_END=1247 /DNA_ORIENTATION=-
MKVVLAAQLAAVATVAHGKVHFKEEFNDDGWRDRWVDSTWKGESMGTWEHTAGEWYADEQKDKGISTKDKARFYAISSKFDEPFSNKDKDLVVQFSVKDEGRDGSSFCGGGYIKLMGSDIDQENFGGESPYKIMFGKDMCGMDVSRIHLIFNYKGKNLLKDEDIKLEYNDKNEFTHLYTLHLRPDNTYTVYFDLEEKASGALDEGWDFPKKMLDDPEDKKPADWVDEEMMLDPEDVKPEGYDDIPEKIADPEAKKPEDWDDEDDGEWEAPTIANPDFKGPWVQKKIKNPDYKGPFVPKQIPNPDYDDQIYKFDDIGSVGFELWIVDNGSIFDNIYVGDDIEEAKKFAKETFMVTKEGEKPAKEAFDAKKKAEEDAKKEAEAPEEAAEDEEDLDGEEEPEEKEEL